MKKLLCTLIVISLLENVYGQYPQINKIDSLLSFQRLMKNEVASVIVWGYYLDVGKGWFSEDHPCQEFRELNKTDKLGSGLAIILLPEDDQSEFCRDLRSFGGIDKFNKKYDSKIVDKRQDFYYSFIPRSSKFAKKYREGEKIKLRIKLFRDCPSAYGKLLFLVEEIY